MCKNFALSKNTSRILRSINAGRLNNELAQITRAKQRLLKSYQVYGLFLSTTPAIKTLTWLAQKSPLFTNIRHTIPRSQTYPYFFSAEIATASRLFLGSNFVETIAQIQRLARLRASGENPRWEIRKLFPKRQLPPTGDFLSYENDIQRVARRAVVWNSANDPEYAENLQKHIQTPRRAERTEIFFCF